MIYLLFPIIFIMWLLEEPRTRARRYRKSYNWTYQEIGAKLGVSTSTARRWCI